MKKILSIVLAALLIISLLPMAVMAEAPAEVKIKIYNGTAADFTLTIADGDEVYLVAGEEGKDLIKWTEAEAPTDKFVKFAYAADTGVLKTTYNNLVTDQTEAGGYTCHGTWYQAGDYKVEIELIGTNSLTHGNSSSMKFENTGDITISGSGSMDVAQVGSASGAIWCAGGGNLTIKNTTMKFSVNPGSESALHHALYMGKGSVSIEGSKIETMTLGGRLVYLGTNTAKTGRYTLDTDETRFIKIKDSTITGKAGKTMFSSAAPATIENSTLKITLSGSSGPFIEPVPTFVGEFSAIAGLAKNAEKLDKLKEYNEKKLGSYTYFYAVPGIVELLPTEPTTEPTTVPTEPTTPEVTTPDATTPDATTPDATTPTESKPVESKPTESKPAESKPAQADKNDTADKDNAAEEDSGNPLTVVLIILVVLVVLAGGAFGVILYLKKKKAQ